MTGYHVFKDETITGLADEARRLGGVQGNLSVARMKSIFSSVPVGGGSGSGDLPNAETKAFGMQTFNPGAVWLKMGYQGANGYYAVPNITEEMTNGHPYLILVSFDSGGTYIDEIIATETPLFLNPNTAGIGTPNPINWYLYDANYNLGTWEHVDVLENYSVGVPSSMLLWSNYDIQIAEEFGGGDSGWIGYEPIPVEAIENGEFTPVDSYYRITGEMLNQLAAGLQMKTGYQNMLTPAEMRSRIDSTSMFCFESSASGRLLV